MLPLPLAPPLPCSLTRQLLQVRGRGELRFGLVFHVRLEYQPHASVIAFMNVVMYSTEHRRSDSILPVIPLVQS